MSSDKFTKIYIIGSVASGKTTLAKQLSKQLSIPWYELDNVFHMRLPVGDLRGSESDRNTEFRKIVIADKWIVEGIFRECFKTGFDEADTIILLNTPVFKRNLRIMKRWIRQRLRLEVSNYNPTLKMLFLMYKWSFKFERTKADTLGMLHPYKEKLIILNDNTEISAIVK